MGHDQELTCADVTTGETFSIGTSETVRRAAEIMEEANVGFLPVCDDSGDVVGTLTDRDIVIRVIAKGHDAESQVLDVMSSGAQTCGINEKVHNVLDKLRVDGLSRMVCLDENGRLAGVLSIDDLARLQVLPRQVAAAEQDIAAARS